MQKYKQEGNKKGKNTNLISAVAGGNQELFHSDFLAWLMDKEAPHGIGESFLRQVLANVLERDVLNPSAGHEATTEGLERHARFNVLVRLKAPGGVFRSPQPMNWRPSVKQLHSSMLSSLIFS